jgi:hypothetical protein
MKNLDLKAMGVEEMNFAEMRKTDGGNPLAWLVLGLLLAECLDRNADRDFRDGWNSVKDD